MPVCGMSGGGGGDLFNDEPILRAGTRVARVVIHTGQSLTLFRSLTSALMMSSKTFHITEGLVEGGNSLT